MIQSLDNKNISLSIRLLKKNFLAQDCLKENGQLEDMHGGKLIVKSVPPKILPWAKYLNQDLSQSNHSALFFLDINVGTKEKPEKRLFAISFGYGHHLLLSNVSERRFGIIVALNALDKNQLKSSDVFAPSEHSKQKRTQTTRGSNLQGHDFDGYSHILKKITGKVKEEYKHLCKKITASENIKIYTNKPANQLDDLCWELWSLYNKKDYEINFPEFMYIQEVKDNSLIEKLDNKLIGAIQNESDELYLDVPDLIDFQEISYYRFKLKDRKNHPEEESLEISNFYKLTKNIDLDLKKIRSFELCLLDENSSSKRQFSLYNTFVYDCIMNEGENGEKYHLSHGNWYEIENSFFEQLKDLERYKKTKIMNHEIPEFRRSTHKNEEGYNRDFSESIGSDQCYLLDRDCIHIRGYDKIEACDVLLLANEINENYFIHVKRKT